MVRPVVQLAGMHRARNRPVNTDAWSWISELDGQRQAIEALDADAPQRQLLEIKLVAAGGTPPAADGGDA